MLLMQPFAAPDPVDKKKAEMQTQPELFNNADTNMTEISQGAKESKEKKSELNPDQINKIKSTFSVSKKADSSLKSSDGGGKQPTESESKFCQTPNP